MEKFQNKKIALVHDYLLCYGGAEKVLCALCDMFPQAPIYVIAYDRRIVEKYFSNNQIYSSFVQKIPFFKKRPKYLLPMLPIAVESFDLSEYDLVFSSSSAFAKGVITKSNTKHICYCHTPMRFVWDYYHESKKSRIELSGIRGIISKVILHYIRGWDRHCESRVDRFIANSQHTKQRIRKFYRRDAEVIYPPVYLRGVRPPLDMGSEGGYFLIVSQLREYKKIDIAIEAFNNLGLPLVIIGSGDFRKKLEKMAKSNIKFLGWKSDGDVAKYYANCKAFIFPGEEDFGITAVEAMSFGKPVIAYRDSGVAESVIEGETGEFFDDLSSAVLADGVRRLLENYEKYDVENIRQRSSLFGKNEFYNNITQFVESI